MDKFIEGLKLPFKMISEMSIDLRFIGYFISITLIILTIFFIVMIISDIMENKT